MANIMGWKDILRPIRDGYRHLFPTPDTGPTPEERAKQRQLDRLKGFTYFDTIEQLGSWTKAESDPLQRSNTPLLPRPPVCSNGYQKANVLLCHDYSGNYHDYEGSQSQGGDEESYTCEYLQYVDTFIYFSHKLVCVPPPTWTNCLHRNGVKVFGTILVEPQTKDAGRLLQHTTELNWKNESIHFPLAKRLAVISEHCGFDGWLVNIEKPFSKEQWDVRVLGAFLEQLRHDLGSDKSLIWLVLRAFVDVLVKWSSSELSHTIRYDALTDSNKVDYQNALTQQNLAFSEASGRLLTNYCWKDQDAVQSKQLAEHSNIHSTDIFFGVDVWAQNSTKLTHPRVTYPEKGGGGTNTGVAVAKLATIGLSVGIFAPAWSFEHFPGHGRAIERTIWEGFQLPEDVDCSCGNARTRHASNRVNPITHSARSFAAGSESFFYTDFSRGFGKHGRREADELYGGSTIHSQLGAQAVLPNCRSMVQNDGGESAVITLSRRLEDLSGRTQLVIEARSNEPPLKAKNHVYEHYLSLYNLDMPADGSLDIKVVFRCYLADSRISIAFYIKSTSETRHFTCPEHTNIQSIQQTIRSQGAIEKDRIRELGVCLRAAHLDLPPTRILALYEISIMPLSARNIASMCSINNIRLEHRDSEGGHWRLCWAVKDGEEVKRRASGLPYSGITGPFSHFLVQVDGMLVGRAYALETVFHNKMVEIFGEGGRIVVRITGIGFDGRHLAEEVANINITI